MDHNHNHVGHDHNDEHERHNHSKGNALSFAFWLHFILSIIEVIGGIMTNFIAIIADA